MLHQLVANPPMFRILIQMGIEESRSAELGWLSKVDNIDDVLRQADGSDGLPDRTSQRRGSAYYPSTFAFNN